MCCNGGVVTRKCLDESSRRTTDSQRVLGGSTVLVLERVVDGYFSVVHENRRCLVEAFIWFKFKGRFFARTEAVPVTNPKGSTGKDAVSELCESRQSMLSLPGTSVQFFPLPRILRRRFHMEY